MHHGVCVSIITAGLVGCSGWVSSKIMIYLPQTTKKKKKKNRALQKKREKTPSFPDFYASHLVNEGPKHTTKKLQKKHLR
jgi:hypothetical protein